MQLQSTLKSFNETDGANIEDRSLKGRLQTAKRGLNILKSVDSSRLKRNTNIQFSPLFTPFRTPLPSSLCATAPIPLTRSSARFATICPSLACSTERCSCALRSFAVDPLTTGVSLLGWSRLVSRC